METLIKLKEIGRNVYEIICQNDEDVISRNFISILRDNNKKLIFISFYDEKGEFYKIIKRNFETLDIKGKDPIILSKDIIQKQFLNEKTTLLSIFTLGAICLKEITII